MKARYFVFSLVFCFTGTFAVRSQSEFKPSPNADPASANEKFKNYDFLGALKEYLTLVKKDAKDPDLNYRVGFCYLNTNINKSKAIPYLEIASRAEKAPEPDVLFQLGKAYHIAYRFDDALKTFTKFKESGKGNSDTKKQTDLYIQYCYNAKELIKFPLDVTFTNLGKNINSPYPDYYPFVPTDEDFLVYNTRRKEGGMMMLDGGYTSSVFISKVVNGEFTKGKTIGPPINTGDDEEVVGLSNSGDIMLLVYDNMVDFANLYIAYADKKLNFKKATVLPKGINTGAQEIAGSITEDGNALYITSTRSGGFGGSDLYVSRKLPDGSWSPCQNLGPEINTDANEDFPNISADGKTLYFSSNGRSSMGGQDIFKAVWDEENMKWTNVKNIGYPLNTTDDDMNLRLSANGRHGYIAAVREGGFGDLDIYRVDFNSVEANLSLVSGKIVSADTGLKKINFADVFITVTDNKTKEVFGNYVPNPNTGKYVIILPSGDYTFGVEHPGYQPFEEKVIIAEKVSIRQEITKDITIYPVGMSRPEAAPVKTPTVQKKTK